MIDWRIWGVSQHVSSNPACVREAAQIKTRQESEQISPSTCGRKLITADVLVGRQAPASARPPHPPGLRIRPALLSQRNEAFEAPHSSGAQSCCRHQTGRFVEDLCDPNNGGAGWSSEEEQRSSTPAWVEAW